MSDPLVSVVMSVYNDKKYVRDAIESILEQSYNNIEFIIIDDGSTDGTEEILANFTRNHDNISLITNRTNIGLTESLNKGIRESSGKLIARQDADDRSLPKRIEKQVDYMTNNDSVLVGSDVYYIDESGDHIGERRYKSNPSTSDLLETGQYIHGTIMVRREALFEVGLYDSRFEYAQDYELILRLSNLGECVNLDVVLYEYRFSNEKIGQKHAIEQRLYILLAKKLELGDWGEDELRQAEKDITALIDRLSIDERSDLHLYLAYHNLQNNNKKCRTHALKSLYYRIGLTPILMIILSYSPYLIYQLVSRVYNKHIKYV